MYRSILSHVSEPISNPVLRHINAAARRVTANRFFALFEATFAKVPAVTFGNKGDDEEKQTWP